MKHDAVGSLRQVLFDVIEDGLRGTDAVDRDDLPARPCASTKHAGRDIRSMRSSPTGGRPLPALGECGSITLRSSAHGTMCSMGARKTTRLVGLRYCSS